MREKDQVKGRNSQLEAILLFLLHCSKLAQSKERPDTGRKHGWEGRNRGGPGRYTIEILAQDTPNFAHQDK
jgi:hypothetical protein